MNIPTIDDVRDAQARIAPYLPQTPLYEYPALGELVGARVWVKHENHLPTCAFKVRGGVNLAAQLTEDERSRGLIAASTGNHGQSVAYGAMLHGVRAVICVPEHANPVKVDSIRRLGAEIDAYGRDYDEAKEHAEQRVAAEGFRYVHSGDEPKLIAGVGTSTLEIFATLPDVEVIVVPIGGGSGAAGACIVAKALRADVEVIGVQSEAAPAAYRSWQARGLVEDRNETFAEGLATRSSFALPQRIIQEHLDDFVLVSDDDIRSAQRTMIEATRNLVEAAGAAALAGALRARERLAGRRVVVVCSGGNVSLEQLRELLGDYV